MLNEVNIIIPKDPSLAGHITVLIATAIRGGCVTGGCCVLCWGVATGGGITTGRALFTKRMIFTGNAILASDRSSPRRRRRRRTATTQVAAIDDRCRRRSTRRRRRDAAQSAGAAHHQSHQQNETEQSSREDGQPHVVLRTLRIAPFGSDTAGISWSFICHLYAFQAAMEPDCSDATLFELVSQLFSVYTESPERDYPVLTSHTRTQGPYRSNRSPSTP